jgi:hypothetical protein
MHHGDDGCCSDMYPWTVTKHRGFCYWTGGQVWRRTSRSWSASIHVSSLSLSRGRRVSYIVSYPVVITGSWTLFSSSLRLGNIFPLQPCELISTRQQWVGQRTTVPKETCRSSLPIYLPNLQYLGAQVGTEQWGARRDPPNALAHDTDSKTDRCLSICPQMEGARAVFHLGKVEPSEQGMSQ